MEEGMKRRVQGYQCIKEGRKEGRKAHPQHRIPSKEDEGTKGRRKMKEGTQEDEGRKERR
jgi:hypothetical protein